LEISKIFSLSAAVRLYLFLISGGGLEIFKIFSVSAAAAVFFGKNRRQRRLSRSAYTSNFTCFCLKCLF
jgi:hypothetical protein